jgi:hypothetical protein
MIKFHLPAFPSLIVSSLLTALLWPAQPAGAVNYKLQAGEVEAEYTDQPGSFCSTNPQLKITRGGETKFEGVPQVEGFCRFVESGFRIQDLDGDRELEVTADFFSGGAHCCLSSLIFSYDAATQTYKPLEHFWGDGGETRLEDLEADGIPEFVSYDTRFAYAFASFAGSGFPIQIWRYQQGRMVDVTRSYPKQIYDDAYKYWQSYTEARSQNREVKGLLAAYLANKYLLNQADDGWTRLRSVYQESDRTSFFMELTRFLAEHGYEARISR